VSVGNPSGQGSVESRVMKPNPRSLAAAFVILTVIGAACAKATTTGGGGSSSGIEHPMGPNDLVLKVETGGGFVAPATHFKEFPSFALYGDGRLIVQGAQIEIYPGPALPSLQVTRISEEGIQAILEGAQAAGLLGPDKHYDFMTISDAPTTTFTTVAEGGRHVVSVYALGESAAAGNQGISPGELQAREALAAFQGKLGDLGSWLPQGSLTEEGPYRFEELRIFVLDQSASPEPGLEQKPVDWPLSPPLASFGQPVTNGPEGRCGSVSGDDLKSLLPLAEKANELTPWQSGGTDYTLVLRPLLPDENGCEGL
jgi:hypothetical protein